MSTERRASQDKGLLSEIQAKGGNYVAPNATPAMDSGIAQALTQQAIINLGGAYASMTDHKPVDSGLAQAQTLVAISKKGESSVPENKAPADRATGEALTLMALSSPKAKENLKPVDSKAEEGLSDEKKAELLAAAAEEKERIKAAHTFGGGDAKAGMAGILSEIQNQGGIIAVPAGKGPANVALTQAKVVMEVNSLAEQPIFASMQDHAPVDAALAAAKIQIAIKAKGETAANAEKAPVDRVLAEALTMKALTSQVKKASLKHVDAPAQGLTAEKLASLQEDAKAEKAEVAEAK